MNGNKATNLETSNIQAPERVDERAICSKYAMPAF